MLESKTQPYILKSNSETPQIDDKHSTGNHTPPSSVCIQDSGNYTVPSAALKVCLQPKRILSWFPWQSSWNTWKYYTFRCCFTDYTYKSQSSWNNFGCVHTLPQKTRKFPWRKHNTLIACTDRRIHHLTLLQAELLKLAERQHFLGQAGRCCSSEHHLLAATAPRGCSQAVPGPGASAVTQVPCQLCSAIYRWLWHVPRSAANPSQLQEWLGARMCFPGGTQDVFIHTLHHSLLFPFLGVVSKSGNKDALYELPLF